MSDRTRRLTAAQAHLLTLPTQPYLSCEDCFRLMDEYVETLLAGAAEPSPAMTLHLHACAACAEEAASLVVLLAQEADLDPGRALALLGTDAEAGPLG